MVQAPSAELIAAFEQSTDPSFQLECLKQIKSSIIGHDHRKERTVKNGLLEPLVHVLSESSTSNGNSATTDITGQAWHNGSPTSLQLECIIVLGALAAGGSQFVAPLLAAGADKLLSAWLSATTDLKPRLAILQALTNLARSYAALTDSDGADEISAHFIFTSDTVTAFASILRQHPTSSSYYKQLRFVCEIIAFAARREETKAVLASSDVTTTLASLLVQQLEYSGKDRETSHAVSILSALCTIISGSTYRTRLLIHSQPLKDCATRTLKHCDDMRNGAYQRVPANQSTSSVNIPFYNELTPFWSANNHNSGDDAHIGFGVIVAMLGYARSTRGSTRLSALRLVALVDAAISDADTLAIRPQKSQKMRDREKHLAMLAVPLAVKLVKDSADSKAGTDIAAQSEQRLVKEQACEVLAMLIDRSKWLQLSAADAGAIKPICSILRKTFDSIPLPKSIWVPHQQVDDATSNDTCRLGERGLPAELCHIMRCRLGALEALAALADDEDYHRKQIVECGVVTCIISSLKPFSRRQKEMGRNIASIEGNTNAVLLAACHSAMTLSRSVSLLRTSLIDAGVAKPILDLLSYHEPEIQVAATKVCSNLVLDFSPMRDDLLANGVIETLCEHTKAGSAALKLSSLWALKHLVDRAPVDLKITMMQNLGVSWLYDAITGQQFSPPPSRGGVSVTLNSANAAGEQIDLLNPSGMDVDRTEQSDDADDDDDDGELLYDAASRTHYHASSIRSTLQAEAKAIAQQQNESKIEELDPAIQARREDLAFQKQALDFLRNFLSGDSCADMVDHIFQQMGQQKFLDLLASKLLPISAVQHRHHLRPSTASKSSTNRPVYNPSDLVLSTIHVIVHVSNGSVGQKAALVAHRALLQAMLPHFAHPDSQIRLMCLWCVNALTYEFDDRDRLETRKRAQELRILGIEAAVRSRLDDESLDVRQRVKTAIDRLENL